ncbi:MAG: outer membrane protein assembly factor BamD [Candidatus Pacebacteria bacterium]|nr:outer membrane protein assembly factor BamD [Candidatus Paceibacterota bacterium]
MRNSIVKPKRFRGLTVSIPFSLKSLPIGLGLALILALSGCAKKSNEFQELSVEQLYNDAMDSLQARKFADSKKQFDEVSRQHPYSIWSPRAELMGAYSLFISRQYPGAVNALQSFIEAHPGNPAVPYAYYLKGMCYYYQIEDVDRDQSMTENAQESFSELIRRFPQSVYARDARLKLDLTHDHLGGKEMAIGRWYQNQELYGAAILRFRAVATSRTNTSHVPEALQRLVESYLALGLKEEAIANAAVLGHNYPDSIWYHDTYELVKNLPEVMVKNQNVN